MRWLSCYRGLETVDILHILQHVLGVDLLEHSNLNTESSLLWHQTNLATDLVDICVVKIVLTQSTVANVAPRTGCFLTLI